MWQWKMAILPKSSENCTAGLLSTQMAPTTLKLAHQKMVSQIVLAMLTHLPCQHRKNMIESKVCCFKVSEVPRATKGAAWDRITSPLSFGASYTQPS